MNESIYCHGKLLDLVQKSGIFQDSKTFVDMPMKDDPEIILKKFDKLYSEHNGEVGKCDLEEFIKEHFEKPGNELEEYTPLDWTDSPNILQKIQDPELKHWTSDLNSIWKSLSRKMKDHVIQFPDRTSLVPVPNPFVVPGDRFQETYYWDSYWIINGLLLCDMVNTVKGMLGNFISLINKFGFVPNGCRIYFAKRSQPPLLIPMVDSYYERTKDLQFIQDNIQVLEREYHFWVTHRTVKYTDQTTGKTHDFCVYGSESDEPRPEGYAQDILIASSVKKEKRRELFRSIAAACESGWDFSVRWFRDLQQMGTICTESIAPVDLNSFIGWNERLLAKFYGLLGLEKQMVYYMDKFKARVQTISEVMWNEEQGCWFDVDLEGRCQRHMFLLSNVTPLFTGCFNEADKPHLSSRLVMYLQKCGALNNSGGIPNSMTSYTGQQWDFPSCWPPSIHMLIEGLSDAGIPEAENMARDLTHRWLQCNYTGWRKYGTMFEKYSVLEPGSPGGGGEYSVQKGFGWTNAVVLMLIDKYADTIKLRADVLPTQI